MPSPDHPAVPPRCGWLDLPPHHERLPGTKPPRAVAALAWSSTTASGVVPWGRTRARPRRRHAACLRQSNLAWDGLAVVPRDASWEWRTRWRDLERSSSTWWRVAFRRRLEPNVSASTGAWRRERGRRRLGPASDDRLVVGDVKHDRLLQGFHLGCRGGVGQRRGRGLGLWPWNARCPRSPSRGGPRATSSPARSPRWRPSPGRTRLVGRHDQRHRIDESRTPTFWTWRRAVCSRLGIPGDARSGPARTPRWPGRCHTLRGEGLRGADWCHAAPRRLANRDVPRGASRS